MKGLNCILENFKINIQDLKKISGQEAIDIKSTDIKSEKDYKVYKYIPIKNINIVITNSLRLDEPNKKIEKLNELQCFLNSKNIEEYNALINASQDTSIEHVNEIEKNQQEFKNEYPCKVKYENDYLWQIYYIKRSNKYYMVVPIQETKQQTFIYLLRKKIEKSKDKIYIPICNLDYENELIENTKIDKLENYLLYFTNNWPSIYEVHNGGNKYIEIIGKLEIYEGIISDYKLHFEGKEEINDFYNLIENLFNLQTELSKFFSIEIILDENAKMHFYYNDSEITINYLQQFYNEEINKNIKSIRQIEEIQKELTKEQNDLNFEEKKLNADLLNKQRQISRRIIITPQSAVI